MKFLRILLFLSIIYSFSYASLINCKLSTQTKPVSYKTVTNTQVKTVAAKLKCTALIAYDTFSGFLLVSQKMLSYTVPPNASFTPKGWGYVWHTDSKCDFDDRAWGGNHWIAPGQSHYAYASNYSASKTLDSKNTSKKTQCPSGYTLNGNLCRKTVYSTSQVPYCSGTNSQGFAWKLQGNQCVASEQVCDMACPSPLVLDPNTHKCSISYVKMCQEKGMTYNSALHACVISNQCGTSSAYVDNSFCAMNSNCSITNAQGKCVEDPLKTCKLSNYHYSTSQNACLANTQCSSMEYVSNNGMCDSEPYCHNGDIDEATQCKSVTNVYKTCGAGNARSGNLCYIPNKGSSFVYTYEPLLKDSFTGDFKSYQYGRNVNAPCTTDGSLCKFRLVNATASNNQICFTDARGVNSCFSTSGTCTFSGSLTADAGIKTITVNPQDIHQLVLNGQKEVISIPSKTDTTSCSNSANTQCVPTFSIKQIHEPCVFEWWGKDGIIWKHVVTSPNKGQYAYNGSFQGFYYYADYKCDAYAYKNSNANPTNQPNPDYLIKPDSTIPDVLTNASNLFNPYSPQYIKYSCPSGMSIKKDSLGNYKCYGMESVKGVINSNCSFSAKVGINGSKGNIIAAKAIKGVIQFWNPYEQGYIGSVSLIPQISSADSNQGYVYKDPSEAKLLHEGFTGFTYIDNAEPGYNEQNTTMYAVYNGSINKSECTSLVKDTSFGYAVAMDQTQKSFINGMAVNAGQFNCVVSSNSAIPFSQQINAQKKIYSPSNALNFVCSPLTCLNHQCQYNQCPSGYSGSVYSSNMMNNYISGYKSSVQGYNPSIPTVSASNVCTSQNCDSNKPYLPYCGIKHGCPNTSDVYSTTSGQCVKVSCPEGSTFNATTQQCQSLQCVNSVNRNGKCYKTVY